MEKLNIMEKPGKDWNLEFTFYETAKEIISWLLGIIVFIGLPIVVIIFIINH